LVGSVRRPHVRSSTVTIAFVAEHKPASSVSGGKSDRQLSAGASRLRGRSKRFRRTRIWANRTALAIAAKPACPPCSLEYPRRRCRRGSTCRRMGESTTRSAPAEDGALATACLCAQTCWHRGHWACGRRPQGQRRPPGPYGLGNWHAMGSGQIGVEGPYSGRGS